MLIIAHLTPPLCYTDKIDDKIRQGSYIKTVIQRSVALISRSMSQASQDTAAEYVKSLPTDTLSVVRRYVEGGAHSLLPGQTSYIAEDESAPLLYRYVASLKEHLTASAICISSLMTHEPSNTPDPARTSLLDGLLRFRTISRSSAQLERTVKLHSMEKDAYGLPHDYSLLLGSNLTRPIDEVLTELDGRIEVMRKDRAVLLPVLGEIVSLVRLQGSAVSVTDVRPSSRNGGGVDHE